MSTFTYNWIDTPPSVEEVKQADTDELWNLFMLCQQQKDEPRCYQIVRSEILRRARLGAKIERMPEGIGIVHRNSQHDGDWVTFRDDEHFKFGGCIGSHSLEAIIDMLDR